jgi:hypothetical protein
MRNLSFLTLLLIGCSSPTVWQKSRSLASLQNSSGMRLEVQLTYPLIFANGANAQILDVKVLYPDGQIASVHPSDIELHTDVPVLDEKKYPHSEGVQIIFRPSVKSTDVKLMVSWKEHVSEIIEVKTTINPLKEKLTPLKSQSNTMSYVSGLYYETQDKFLPHQYEGFSINNDGINRIVTQNESGRDFDFEYEEQAAQNVAMMISDSPNSTVSHIMHSYFMFFPRHHLPFAQLSEEKITVTLPTGEKMVFAKNGEIIDGVFKEGPVDVGPDRFKRQYADLRYQGKGIVLRANARGQMPQQGQFENTSIDMDYGIKFSNDVLIINGSTGQRCRRPKKDFWSSADVSPIQFKFPSDAEFDQYLKQFCKFGIPDLPALTIPKKKDVTDEVLSMWKLCEDKNDVRECLEKEGKTIEDPRDRQKIAFALIAKFYQALKEEKDTVSILIEQEIKRLNTQLDSDVSWLRNSNPAQAEKDCLARAKTLAKNPLRFQDGMGRLQESFSPMCAQLISTLYMTAEKETQFLKEYLLADLTWIKDNAKLADQCLSYGLALMTQGKRFSQQPSVYEKAIKKICETIPASAPYKNWLSYQQSEIESRISIMVMEMVEKKAEQTAKSCLEKYPTNTQMNRLLHKKDREACLINVWDKIEDEALAAAAADPMVKLLNLSLTSVEEKLVMERRRTQLRVIKKYFL